MAGSNLFLTTAIAAVSLFVQAPEGRFQQRDRPPRPQRMNLAVAALDTDKDGSISADEIRNAPKSLLILDRNGDSRITSDELMPPDGGSGGERGAGGERRKEGAGLDPRQAVAALMAFDKNGDGKLSREELPERMQGMMDRGDSNHDGFLTPEEIRALLDAQEAASKPVGPGDRSRAQFNLILNDPLLKALDTDHDGIISAEEIRNSVRALLSLDRNGDGQLTPDEFRPVQGPRPEGERN